MDSGFAAIDLETTGFHPSHHHRVIEVAIVQFSRDLAPETEYVSLVNPNRDLGPTHIHGVRGRDAQSAPEFAEVADDIVEHLRGRTVVGHNLRFDLGFLDSEFSRLGFVLPALTTIDTLTITGESLGRSCEQFGVTHEDAHSALGDAKATAELLRKLASDFPGGAAGISRAMNDGRRPPPDEAWPALLYTPTSYRRSDVPEEEPPAVKEVEIESGMQVCFTGESRVRVDGELLNRNREQELASEAGLIVKSSVTKKLSFLVAADPHSLSGKARKARERRVPIVHQVSFWRSFGMSVESIDSRE